jgi:hypothetical protein
MPSKKDKAIDKASLKEKLRFEEEQKQKEEKEWEIGTNRRALSKEAKKNQKHEEEMIKATEMKALIAAEENISIKGKKLKSKKTKGDDMYLLSKAFAEAPKSKSEKEKENKEKLNLVKKEERRQKELELENEKIIKAKNDYLLEQKGIVIASDLNVINNNVNIDDVHSSGIDSALDIFSDNEQNTNNIKMLYKSFYNDQILMLKEINPGLRLSQYNDKIQKLWKNCPQNPFFNRCK